MNPASLSPKASDIDCQLASMYMNLFVGSYAELREQYPIDNDCLNYNRRDLMDQAHAEAIRTVKRFREEMLDGKSWQAHDETNDNRTSERDSVQDGAVTDEAYDLLGSGD